jgi:anhydro-N-acetylmuramic acid kinase
MRKIYTSLGLMSGTSMDGVDASIIQSDGDTKFKGIFDKYFEYPTNIYNNLTTLRNKIKKYKDLKKHQKQVKSVEKEITIFHAESVNKFLKKIKLNIDFIGFHGQTIYHNADEKITKQLGDGKLLSKLTRKKVVYNFRQNDLKNGGQGAPLAPIFHKLLEKKFIRKKEVGKYIKPVHFVNIGGVANRTTISEGLLKDFTFSATDIGPGMCLIDKWIKKNSKKKYDKNGNIAEDGKINKKILNKALENFWDKLSYIKNTSIQKIMSYDVSDFNSSLVQGLSLEDGAATLTEYTAKIIYTDIFFAHNKIAKVILCGGGRKNKFLFKRIKKLFTNNISIQLIDDYGIDGDFVESQAFGYLAIRSHLKLPISFPSTTGCKKASTGGVIVKNY